MAHPKLKLWLQRSKYILVPKKRLVPVVGVTLNSKEILPDIDFQEVNGRLSDSINRSKQILADFLEN